MKEKSNMLVLPCDCKCCMLVIEKTGWEDGDISYNISVQDSRYDHNYNTLLGRIKRAAKVLFGKPIYYNEKNLSINLLKIWRVWQGLNTLRGNNNESCYLCTLFLR